MNYPRIWNVNIGNENEKSIHIFLFIDAFELFIKYQNKKKINIKNKTFIDIKRKKFNSIIPIAIKKPPVLRIYH